MQSNHMRSIKPEVGSYCTSSVGSCVVGETLLVGGGGGCDLVDGEDLKVSGGGDGPTNGIGEGDGFAACGFGIGGFFMDCSGNEEPLCNFLQSTGCAFSEEHSFVDC
ncbi:hypothetical protein QYF36_011763 [Acer negundo]|nr:hypothetical protein QYF36_011763 [Acer negundo]